MVVNTDTSKGGGIHWFSIFIDFEATPITIEYFNSSGYDIKNKEFKKFFVDLADTISLKKRECKFVKVSDIQHQNSNTSNCGVYALYYIWKRLGGESIEFFKKNKINDDHIVLFRKYFFTSKS
jgi:Ulp1 family protease